MKILIGGCGWLGLALGASLVRRGHEVVGIRRSPAAAEKMDALGIRPLILDLLRPGAADDLPGKMEAVVASQAAGGGGAENYRRTYVDATRILLDHAESRGASRFVYTGSTGVFGQTDGSDVDETSPTLPARPTAERLVEAEGQVLGRRGTVVRLSGLYGPGRLGVVERVRQGRLALGPGDQRYMNHCHLRDAVATVEAALLRGRPGAVYHASDAESLRVRELVPWVAERLGIAAPSRTAPGASEPPAHRRILAAATRRELDLRPIYPSVLDGLAAEKGWPR